MSPSHNKIVGDNIDKSIKPRYMKLHSGNSLLHYDRVDVSNLFISAPPSPSLTPENCALRLLPSANDDEEMKKNSDLQNLSHSPRQFGVWLLLWVAHTPWTPRADVQEIRSGRLHDANNREHHNCHHTGSTGNNSQEWEQNQWNGSNYGRDAHSYVPIEPHVEEYEVIGTPQCTHPPNPLWWKASTCQGSWSCKSQFYWPIPEIWWIDSSCWGLAH